MNYVRTPARIAAFEARKASSGWTDARVERLRALNDKGWSASQIARDLGNLTRSAVIGKLNRLGIGMKSGVNRRAKIQLRLQAVADKPPRPPKAPKPAKPPIAIAGNGATFQKPESINRPWVDPAKLEARMNAPVSDAPSDVHTCAAPCKWPLGDPQDADFHFCGKRSQIGKPYCPSHARRAYQPMTDAKAKNAHAMPRAMRRYA